MKIKLVQRRNPQEPQSPAKYYAAPKNDGRMELDDLAEQISGRSSLTHGDILNVLQNLTEVIPFHLMAGKSINLGNLATIRLSFSGKGVESPEDFNTHMIKTKRIIFTPGTKLKDQIGRMKFETDK